MNTMSGGTRIVRIVGCRLTFALACCLIVLFVCASAPTGAQAQSASTVSPQAVELNKHGEKLLAKKSYKAAVAEFRKALAIEPDYEDAVHNLGKAV